MDSVDDRRAVSALAKLLRDALRNTRFSVSHLTRSDTEFRRDDSSTITAVEETSEREFNADGLRALDSTGGWKRDLFRKELRVNTLPENSGSAARITSLERVLDDLGVLGDGHVVHALGSLLPGYTQGYVQRDSPDKKIGVAKTADLWSYLLVDACLHTPRRTASRVLRWSRGARLAFETRVLLGRLRAADPFALANGLAVERLPHQSKDLNTWLPIELGIPPSDYLDRTMLHIPCTIAPALSKPFRVISRHKGVPQTSWRIPAKIESNWPLPLGGIHELTRALSLVCDIAVETPMIWLDYGDNAHFGQRYGMSNSGTGDPIPRSASESPLTARDLREAIRLQPHLCDAPAKVQKAIQYWLKSKSRRVDDADRLVFVRTALEALFLDGGNRGALTFRLATNGAWYTGRNRTERQDRYDLLKNIYRAASGAVHTGGVTSESQRLLEHGQEICRQAILKRLRSKRDPVWREIVFGG